MHFPMYKGAVFEKKEIRPPCITGKEGILWYCGGTTYTWSSSSALNTIISWYQDSTNTAGWVCNRSDTDPTDTIFKCYDNNQHTELRLSDDQGSYIELLIPSP